MKLKSVTMQMPTVLLLVLFSLNTLFQKISCARILGYIPTPSYSHQVAFHPLWRELSLRGHQLTVITTNPIKNLSLTNLTEIDLHFSYELWYKLNFNELADRSTFMMFDQNSLIEIVEETLDKQLGHQEVQALIKNESEHFDLVMVEGFLHAAFAFTGRFKCPMIQIFSMDATVYNYINIGNPAHPVLNPDFMLPFTENLTFFERLVSTLMLAICYLYIPLAMIPRQQMIVDKHFGKGLPPLSDLERNVSLLFINTNSVFHAIRPLLPNVIQIGGGTHLSTPQSLPQDLQKRLDGAPNGFIYFSLGTNIKSKYLSEEMRAVFLETFAKLPYLVLWKFEMEDLVGKPDNVVVSKWFPQQDVFRHPNIKLFISQGGLQSMEEAIYNHIPIIGIPFLADQLSNIKGIVSKGLGLSIDRTTITKTSFKDAILEVINNPKYRNRVEELAELARDQPIKGLDKAVWWTEYVLRHKGATHLKSPAMDLPFYQYFLLDVISFCLLIIATVVFLLYKLLKFTSKCLRCIMPTEKIKTQ